MVQYEWGFDLTDFGNVSDFTKLLKKFTLNKKKKVNKGDGYYQYEWYNPELKLITDNNPITGEYKNPRLRKPEKGYASYIGIEGNNEKEVHRLAKYISSHANSIKGESPNERAFI